ncbi:MAG: SDR family oxidoreductase [Acidobacteria bacterium]|nr:SDR family oxidoreductase [Acidobacteriota bacterium]
MPKTVLITGSSSGIGKATASYFAEQGWNVVATMRTPENAGEWAKHSNITLIRLDVLDLASIQEAIRDSLRKFGKIDAVMNNAGYGLVGPFEASTNEQIKRQFDTNVFGLMNVCREIIPHFREQRGGTIINVASMGGRLTFPLYSLYHGTKWAVEGFSESLQFELQPFKIRLKIIEPGAIKTDFYDRSMEVMSKPGLTVYDAYVNKALPNMNKFGETAPGPEKVAQVIYQAATDGSGKLRYQVNSAPLLALRRLLPLSWFQGLMRKIILK